MRRNDVFGLQWSDLDVKKGTVAISRGIVDVGYEIRQTRGKTPRSRRPVDLDRTTLDLLASRRAWRLAEANVGASNEDLAGFVRRPKGQALPRSTPGRNDATTEGLMASTRDHSRMATPHSALLLLEDSARFHQSGQVALGRRSDTGPFDIPEYVTYVTDSKVCERGPRTCDQ